jgi:hypothetical protein
MPREKAAYIILRRKLVSINELSKAFGRSTSVIHRILQVAGGRRDLRKLPARTRILASLRNHKMMMTRLAAWEAFILGNGEKPP